MHYLFVLAIAPVIFLLSYVKKKDPNPEPKNLLTKIFIFGCLTIIPAVILENVYSAFFIGEKEVESFADIFFGVALIEEFVKWIVVYVICFKNKHFDETYDAIVYAAYSALAFACIENILYVLLDEDGAGIFVGIMRAFTAVPGHLFDGVIMGYYFAKARSAKAQNRSAFGLLLCSLFVPAFVHGIYDWLLEIEAVLIWLVFFIGIAIFCISLIKSAAKKNVAISDGITTPVAQPATQPVTPMQPVQQSVAQPVQQPVTPQPTPQPTEQPATSPTPQISYDWGTSTEQPSSQTNQPQS